MASNPRRGTKDHNGFVSRGSARAPIFLTFAYNPANYGYAQAQTDATRRREPTGPLPQVLACDRRRS